MYFVAAKMRLLLSDSIRNSVSSRLHSAMDPRQPVFIGRKKLPRRLSVKSRVKDNENSTWTAKIAQIRKKLILVPMFDLFTRVENSNKRLCSHYYSHG